MMTLCSRNELQFSFITFDATFVIQIYENKLFFLLQTKAEQSQIWSRILYWIIRLKSCISCGFHPVPVFYHPPENPCTLYFVLCTSRNPCVGQHAFLWFISYLLHRFEQTFTYKQRTKYHNSDLEIPSKPQCSHRFILTPHCPRSVPWLCPKVGHNPTIILLVTTDGLFLPCMACYYFSNTRKIKLRIS